MVYTLGCDKTSHLFYGRKGLKLRTKLSERILPAYTRKEERVNMVSHIVGSAMSGMMLVICMIVAIRNQNAWGIVSGTIYCLSTLLLFVMSSIYHGLKPSMAKKVFQVLDHCSIYVMIAGTYTPVLLGIFRKQDPVGAWTLLVVIWALAALGIVLKAIDLKKFKGLTMTCYLGMGWCILVRLHPLFEAYGKTLFALLLAGGVLYTVGVAFYALGRKVKYMHSVFHFMINIAAALHFLGIVLYVLPYAA